MERDEFAEKFNFEPTHHCQYCNNFEWGPGYCGHALHCKEMKKRGILFPIVYEGWHCDLWEPIKYDFTSEKK